MKQNNEMNRLEGLKILLAVSGGISAYKAVDLASKLTAEGASIKTVMTESASQLVGPKSFEGVSGSSVFTSLWQTGGPRGNPPHWSCGLGGHYCCSPGYCEPYSQVCQRHLRRPGEHCSVRLLVEADNSGARYERGNVAKSCGSKECICFANDGGADNRPGKRETCLRRYC